MSEKAEQYRKQRPDAPEMALGRDGLILPLWPDVLKAFHRHADQRVFIRAGRIQLYTAMCVSGREILAGTGGAWRGAATLAEWMWGNGWQIVWAHSAYDI